MVLFFAPREALKHLRCPCLLSPGPWECDETPFQYRSREPGMSRQQIPNDTDAAGNKDTGDFFARHGLPPIETRDLCWDFIRTKYSNNGTKINDHDIREARHQGFCSYTLFIGSRHEIVVQFRPLAHKLDLDTINAARRIYGELVAVTELIGCLCVRKTDQSKDSPISTDPLQNHDSSNGKKTSDPSLLVYSLSRIRGMSLAELYSTWHPHLPTQCQYQHRASFVKFFAVIISQGLLSSPRLAHSAVPKGPVGSTIRHRLEMMQRDLPTRFRPTVETILHAWPKIEALPWVLTHGDLVPSNVILDFCHPHPQPLNNTKEEPAQRLPVIRGLVDWAEAEYLPFGVGIYGLEEFLGTQFSTLPINDSNPDDTPESSTTPLPTPSPTPTPTQAKAPKVDAVKLANSGSKYPPPGSKFYYHPNAESLRSLFWSELEAKIRGAHNANPFLHTSTTQDKDKDKEPTTPPPPPPPPPSLETFLETVQLARTLGILLWHGIAFDDGRLDRVVCEGRDDEEIQRLDMHLHLHLQREILGEKTEEFN